MRAYTIPVVSAACGSSVAWTVFCKPHNLLYHLSSGRFGRYNYDRNPPLSKKKINKPERQVRSLAFSKERDFLVCGLHGLAFLFVLQTCTKCIRLPPGFFSPHRFRIWADTEASKYGVPNYMLNQWAGGGPSRLIFTHMVPLHGGGTGKRTLCT